MENHFESGQRKVSESSSEKDGVVLVETLDGDGVVEGNGVGRLGSLVAGILRDELHLRVVVRVATDLQPTVFRQIRNFLNG